MKSAIPYLAYHDLLSVPCNTYKTIVEAMKWAAQAWPGTQPMRMLKSTNYRGYLLLFTKISSWLRCTIQKMHEVRVTTQTRHGAVSTGGRQVSRRNIPS